MSLHTSELRLSKTRYKTSEKLSFTFQRFRLISYCLVSSLPPFSVPLKFCLIARLPPIAVSPSNGFSRHNFPFVHNPIWEPLSSTSLFPCDESLRLECKLVQKSKNEHSHKQSNRFCFTRIFSFLRWTNIFIYSVWPRVWDDGGSQHDICKCKRDF